MENLRVQSEDFEVQYEILPANDETAMFEADIATLDEYFLICQKKADKYNSEIERLTNDADWINYTIAVSSGVFTGLLDIFVVGELDLKACNEWGSEKVNKFVKKVAGETGEDPDSLKRAIKKLEEKSKVGFASDPNLNDFGGGKQHHFRDFAHHPTITGWMFSMLTQFTENCYGTDTAGKFIVVPVKDKTRIGSDLHQKFVFGTVLWFFHLVSDMAGTHDTAGSGTGIPGPLLSLAKELSTIPPFNKAKIGDMELSVFLSKLFNGTLYAKRDANGKLIKESIIPIDLRTELGIIKAQAMPVVINELIVRTFYAIRRIVEEIKVHPVSKFSDLKELNWERIIPFRNRTVIRMLTISSGTFMAIDIADAAIRASKDASAGAAAGPAGASVAFASSFLLRVNFVGIGRFTVAVCSDVSMGVEKQHIEARRVIIYNEMLAITSAKLYYKQAEMLEENVKMFEENASMWISAKDTAQVISEAQQVMIESLNYFSNSWKRISKDVSKITSYVEGIEKYNPGLTDNLFPNRKNKIRRGK